MQLLYLFKRRHPSRTHPLVRPLLAAGALLLSVAAQAESVTVAVAANFSGPMPAIVAGFEQASAHKAVVAYGATGKFYAQISHGGPFDVLLAADAATPLRLEQEGLAQPGSRFTYATGKLALWSATAGTVDAQGEVLRRGDFRHLAIANPKTAPYGAAAVAVLTAMGVYPALQSKLVTGESITQAHQFAATGNAELGFVALSQIYQNGDFTAGSHWLVPADLYDPILQDAVLLTRGRDNPAASALLTYLRSDSARQIMRSYGYE